MPKVYPKASFEPLGAQTRPRMKAHDIICLHTMATSFEGTVKTWKRLGYSESFHAHFALDGFGHLVQVQDLDFQSRATGEGNKRIIAIEIADKEQPPFPEWSGSDVPPFTDAQLDTLVELLHWLCEEFDIPKELVPDSKPNRRGIGFHRQGIDHFSGNPNAAGGGWRIPDGEVWSKQTSKVCPGDRRIEQIKTIIVPRIQGFTPGAGDVLDLKPDEVRAVIREEVVGVLNAQARRVPGIASWERYLEVLLAAARKNDG